MPFLLDHANQRVGPERFFVGRDEPDPDYPAQILRVLPEQYHAGFLAEYADAVEKARRPERYAALAALLRL